MHETIEILQIGREDWNQTYELFENAELLYAETVTEELAEKRREPFDLVLWDRAPEPEEREWLFSLTKAHTLYVTETVALTGENAVLYEQKAGQRLKTAELAQFLKEEVRFYFPNPYGEKFRLTKLAVSRNFKGDVRWDGGCGAELTGRFGETFRQIVYWSNNIPIAAGQTIDLWLEYQKTPGVQIRLVIVFLQRGSVAGIARRVEFDEAQLEEPVQIKGDANGNTLFLELHARGEGGLKLIALHDRHSRGTHGYFLPGGRRHVTLEKEEIFSYFDPMDQKPPLNVYFSGYKTREGFEGYGMMRRLGAPFLLIGEPRLEGGCAYIGSGEYEQLLTDVLIEHMQKLGFSSDQVVLSGISMGTCGALYYGCALRPHAIVLGKPLVSLGDVAANERKKRPGGWATSLDMVNYICGETGSAANERLNHKLWERFSMVDWSRTRFLASYMIEDDYDSTAFDWLARHVPAGGGTIRGKGYHGRHNDNTGAIVRWFVRQYERLLREDFGRE